MTADSRERPRPHVRRWPRAAVMGMVAMAAASAGAAAAAAACAARSGLQPTPVVELYTSEGCSSCPPADRWLAALKDRDDVVALAFHVDYWDRLGWSDRFADPAYTRRQVEQQAVNGARFAYTPQVVIDGQDRKDWPRSRVAPRAAAAPVGIALAREGDGVIATIDASAGAPARLAAFWAVTESAHRTAVRAGENQGATLEHEFVVRELQPVAAWTAEPGHAHRFAYAPRNAADPAHPRRIDLVVVDAASGKPVQALALRCR